MNNQIVGIAGVFALTAFLLALRHLFLSIGQSSKNRYVRPMAPAGRYELNSKIVEDDSWLLWSPDNEPVSPDRAGETASRAREPQDTEKPPLRFTTGRRG